MPTMSSTPVSARWEALGTSAVLLVSDPEALGRARAIVERELAQIDRACSRFRPDSDLQRVNAGAGRFVRVSPLPAVMGRVCYHPCEGACNRGELDETVGIHGVERFLGDEAIRCGWRVPAHAQPSGPGRP